MITQALEGLRVLDFSRQMAGPHATVVLSDYGADVIKIESLPHGDPSRRTGTEFYDSESACYLMWNRGKRSIALDMRKPGALEIIHRLAKDADIVLENYRPGVADEIGIGYEQLSKINPGIVYCSVSGFGPDGPDFAFTRYLGHRIEALMPAKDRRWVVDQMMATEVPEAVDILRRAMQGVLSTEPRAPRRPRAGISGD